MLISTIGLLFFALPQSLPASQPGSAAEIVLREFLVLEPVGKAGRNPIHTDALEARIVAGEKIEPREGDSVPLSDGTSKTWQTGKVGDDGALTHEALRGGYAYARVEAEAAGVWLLEAAGHALVYVNGELRTGDPYSLGFVQLPVPLKRGANHFLFQGARGKLRAKLTQPKRPIVLLGADLTTPTVAAGRTGLYYLGVPIANCTGEDQLCLVKVVVDGRAMHTESHAFVPRMSVNKCLIKFDLQRAAAPPKQKIRLTLDRDLCEPLDIELAVVADQDSGKHTFVSGIDASAQYYALNPARPRELGPSEMRLSMKLPEQDPPLILSLHGASVEATNQAAAYGRSWADIVAPTNRRPYGFDWEDWGRLDALEVLDHALQARHGDRRVYLSGHSMGGHGTWQLGVTFPDRFAAIGPSAGWISFWSYGGLRRLEAGNPVIDLLQRAANPSDTLALLSNLAPRGIYILHGDADDNVPVSQAREMREKLAEFHRDFQWHEQPGAGHWWESSDEPGAECVDWPPMMDFFARRRLPHDSEVRDVNFSTASPGVSAECHWAAVEQQARPLAISRVKLHCDPLSRRFAGTTENVRLLSLEVSHVAEGAVSVELDGQKIEGIAPTVAVLSSGWPRSTARPFAKRPGGLRTYLLRDADQWRACNPPPAAEKGPHRYGPFKAAFDNHFVFVVGTQGTPEETVWAFEKARYDAETWWYRGNGTARIMSDLDFARSKHEGNVILYGNATTNDAWTALLSESPVQVERGAVRIGARELRGDDLTCLFVRPKPGDECASVGVVAGTGLPGQRLANRIPYFVSGVAYPDCIVFGADTLSKGPDGIRAAGFFGHDWKIETGEFAFSD